MLLIKPNTEINTIAQPNTEVFKCAVMYWREWFEHKATQADDTTELYSFNCGDAHNAVIEAIREAIDTATHTKKPINFEVFILRYMW